MEKMHKATLAEKFGYGLGELPGTMSSILGAVLTMFYTDSVGFNRRCNRIASFSRLADEKLSCRVSLDIIRSAH